VNPKRKAARRKKKKQYTELYDWKFGILRCGKMFGASA
jgi:transcription elongation factor Elf1